MLPTVFQMHEIDLDNSLKRKLSSYDMDISIIFTVYALQPVC